MAALTRGGRIAAIFGAAAVAAVVFYAATGFYLAPYLLQTRVWPGLSKALGGRFAAVETSFDPFSLRLKIKGFSLTTPNGEPLLAIGESEAEMAAGESLRRHLPVVRLRFAGLEANLKRNESGQNNFDFLAPTPRAKERPGSTVPLVLASIDIENGAIAVDDRFLGEGLKTRFSGLTLRLENLDLGADAPARFWLETREGEQAKLALQGELHLNPWSADSRLSVENLALAPYAAWLGPKGEYRVSDGQLSLNLRYRHASGGKRPESGITEAAAKIRRFQLSRGDAPVIAVASANAEGISLLDARPEMRLREFALQGLEFAASQGKEKKSAALSIEAAKLQDLSFQFDASQLKLKSFVLERAALMAPTSLTNEDGKPRATRVERLRLEDLDANVQRRAARIGAVIADKGALSVWRTQEGGLGLPFISAPASHSEAAESAPWKIGVALLELNDFDLAARDFAIDPPLALRLAPMNLKVVDYASDSDQAFHLGFNCGIGPQGRIALESDIDVKQASADVKIYVDDLLLSPFQPYLDEMTRIDIVKGVLNFNADIDYGQSRPGALRVAGDFAVADFASEDKREGRAFVDWQYLRMNGLIFENAPRRLSIREVNLREPYARAIVGDEGRFNIAENLTPPSAQAPSREAAPNEPVLPVVIGAFHVYGGRADFADLTLKPSHFAADIRDLSGDIRGLSSQENAKADVSLHGKIGGNSPVSITGQINPFKLKAYTDIAMQFRNVNLTTLSPYSSKFAGYRIEKGKLSMDLRYQLDEGALNAENKFTFDHLVLGERVESPTATGLPVSLAVALLKDADGKIDLSLPISGDLGNPNVSVRSLLAGAATELIAKLVSSPFTILGNLAGLVGSEEKLDSVRFAPGAASLEEDEKRKLALIAKALGEKPSLSLEIKGTANQDQDPPALAERELLRQIKNAKLMEARWAGEGKTEAPELTTGDEDYRRLFTQFYRARLPDSPELRELKSGASLAGERFEGAKRRLLKDWPVSELDLRALAQARSQSIRQYLVNEAGLPDQRIYLLDVKFTRQEEREIRALLSLSGS
jgi:hypothetical protein